MNNLKKLALALNKLGLNKEAAQILSLRKIATEPPDPAANNKIRANILELSSVFIKINRIFSEYLEYKRADPNDSMLLKQDLIEMSTEIFSLLSKALTLVEISYNLTTHIGFIREGLLRRTREFLSSLYNSINNLYGLISSKIYETSGPSINKIKVLYWKEGTKKLAAKCIEFVGEGKDDFIEPKKIEPEKRNSRMTYKYDPSDEWTAAGLEDTIPGSATSDLKTSTEITLPTNL